jgi:NAD(P)-dependent dehydrogenase (short-subunit alcohol dehydrogenase family)
MNRLQEMQAHTRKYLAHNAIGYGAAKAALSHMTAIWAEEAKERA